MIENKKCELGGYYVLECIPSCSPSAATRRLLSLSAAGDFATRALSSSGHVQSRAAQTGLAVPSLQGTHSTVLGGPGQCICKGPHSFVSPTNEASSVDWKPPDTDMAMAIPWVLGPGPER
jgi:hypothetical protein